MPNDTQVSKWGNSLAVRIPRAIVEEAGLTEGDRVAIKVTEEGNIVLRSSRRKYSLPELVDGITAGNRHRETGWGTRKGRESW